MSRPEADCEAEQVAGSVRRPVPELVRLSDVTPRPVRWLWPGRLPAGYLSLVDGDPGAGKSTVCVDWAARVTTGSPWPDGAECPAGNVVYLSAEDGTADVLRPRLDAAGGDPARMHALTGVREPDDDGAPLSRPVTLADLGILAEAVQRTAARLVVVDVLAAYMPAGVDSYRDTEVRRVLAGLARIAEDTEAAIVAIRHLRKEGGRAIHAGGGSIAFLAASRAAYLAAADPDDPDRRILAPVRLSHAAPPPALAYRLVAVDGSHATRVEWEPDAVDLTADMLLAAPGQEPAERRSVSDQAAEWLRSYLADREGREAPRTDVLAAGKAAGYKERTIERAKVDERVDHRSEGFPRRTIWSLPASGANTSGATGDEPPAGATGGTGDDQHQHGSDAARRDQSRQVHDTGATGEPGATARDDSQAAAALALVTEQLGARPLNPEGADPAAEPCLPGLAPHRPPPPPRTTECARQIGRSERECGPCGGSGGKIEDAEGNPTGQGCPALPASKGGRRRAS